MERSDRSTPVRHSPLSWACRLALAGVWLAAWAPASEAQTTSLSPRYRFKMMLGGPGYTHAGLASTAIDDLGRIATDVSNGGLVSLVRTDGITTELIADTSGPIASFVNPASMQMNSSGTVAFLANMDDGGLAGFTWDGGTLTEVMNSASLPWSGSLPPTPYPVTYNIHDLSINAAGSVACFADRQNGSYQSGVFLNDGESTALVVQSHSTSSWDYFMPEYVRLLDDGTIATAAMGSMFPREPRCDPPSWADSAIVRLSPFGDILETLAASLTDDTIVNGSSIVWSANNSGDVIYRGGCPGARTMVGASSAGQFLIAESESPGSWDDFNGASISSSGRIAFLGLTGGGAQSFVADGPDPVRNRVLGSGDVIFGKTVQHPQLRFRDAINEAGQICMYVTFTDGTDAIVRADPLPLRRR